MTSDGTRPDGDQSSSAPAPAPPQRRWQWELLGKEERQWHWDPRSPRLWGSGQESASDGESLWSTWSGRWRTGDQEQEDGRFRAFCKRLQERWQQH